MALVCRSRVPSDLKSSGAGGGGAAVGRGATETAVAALGATCGAGACVGAMAAGGLGATALAAGGLAAGAVGTVARGTAPGGGGLTGSITRGWTAVSGVSGATTAGGAVTVWGGVATAGTATGTGIAGEAVGAGSCAGSRFIQAQPAAKTQLRTRALRATRNIAARFTTGRPRSRQVGRDSSPRIASNVRDVPGRESVRFAFQEDKDSSARLSQHDASTATLHEINLDTWSNHVGAVAYEDRKRII
jgi:hypothetical protein